MLAEANGHVPSTLKMLRCLPWVKEKHIVTDLKRAGSSLPALKFSTPFNNEAILKGYAERKENAIHQIVSLCSYNKKLTF